MEECNVGSLEKPKIIKLSETLSPYIKQKYIRLYKEFHDAFVYGDEIFNLVTQTLFKEGVLSRDKRKILSKLCQ